MPTYMNNKIKDIALMIPSFPRDYHYIYNLLNTMAKTVGMDIYIIFSSDSDYQQFEMKDSIHPIIGKDLNKNSIITSKKFYGLKELMNSSYDYIICCDSEADLIQENFVYSNILSKIEDIFKRKRMYGTDVKCTYGSTIMAICASLFANEYEAMKNMTKNYTMWFWWSDIPVYRRKDLEGFFNKINYTNIVWDHFDYAIYQYYLIITEGFYIIDVSSIVHKSGCDSIENMKTNDTELLEELSKAGLGLGLVNESLYKMNKEYLIKKGSFIRFNLDRL
jgi:hypothetical protein